MQPTDSSARYPTTSTGRCALSLLALVAVGMLVVAVLGYPAQWSWLIPGISVTIMAVAASIAAFRDRPSKAEKAAWTLLFMALASAEIRVVTHDRTVQTEEAAKTASDLSETLKTAKAAVKELGTTSQKLDSTSRKIDSTVAQERDHFDRMASRIEDVQQNAIETNKATVAILGRIDLLLNGGSVTATVSRFKDEVMHLSGEILAFAAERRSKEPHGNKQMALFEKETAELYKSEFSPDVESVRARLRNNHLIDPQLDAISKRGVRNLDDVRTVADRLGQLGEALKKPPLSRPDSSH